jgi:hypothetical protein
MHVLKVWTTGGGWEACMSFAVQGMPEAQACQTVGKEWPALVRSIFVGAFV